MSAPTDIAGPAALALAALTPPQRAFLAALPKAELHAHLNGSIPLPLLQQLAAEYTPTPTSDPAPAPAPDAPAVHAGLARLTQPLAHIADFFALFPAIYALTATPPAVARAARAVLHAFLDADAAYLELRTTPRAAPGMTQRDYLAAVLAEVERWPPARAALLVCVDRRMPADAAAAVVRLAAALRAEGRRVVGVDLCGDPLVRAPRVCARLLT